jgi:Ala-tRNA(Pro) deacylase
MELHEQISRRLSDLGIDFRILTHEPVTTSAQAAAARGVDLSTGAKALLVKSGPDYAVFVVPGDRQLDWKAAKRTLRNKSARFATPEEMLELTGLVKGSLPPFGNLFGLPVYVDCTVSDQDLIRFNAGSLTHSVEMPGPRLLAAVDGIAGDFAA